MPQEVEALQYVCSACKRSKIVLKGDEIPFGVHGSAALHADWGGTEEVSFYSCQENPSHVGKAITNAIKEALEK